LGGVDLFGGVASDSDSDWLCTGTSTGFGRALLRDQKFKMPDKGGAGRITRSVASLEVGGG
jgi:hypothetical protein